MMYINILWKLSNLSDTTTSVTIPANYIESGALLFRFTVTDSYLQTSTVTITVENNQIPIAFMKDLFIEK
jgi:hypothetical protein